jgi:predicted glutamine amidotransferase
MVVVNPRRVDVRELILGVYYKAVYNKHGFSIYTVRDGEERVVRTLDFAEFQSFVEKNVDDNEIIHIHFRQATSGAVDEKNIHMWRVNCGGSYYYVSHNGYVGKYARAHVQAAFVGESDTLRFISSPLFRSLLLFKDEGLRYVFNTGFYGVLFATSKTRVIALSRGKPIQAYYDDSTGTLIFVNEEIRYKSNVVSAYGFKFEKRGLLHAELSNTLLSFSTEKMTMEGYVDLMEHVWLGRKGEKLKDWYWDHLYY